VKLANIIFEGKQVGEVYHFAPAMYTDSIKTKGIKFSKSFLPKQAGTKNPFWKEGIKYTISVTRRKTLNWFWGLQSGSADEWEYMTRFTLDGDAISNNYKIIPINFSHINNPSVVTYSKGTPLESYFEEIILSDTPGYLSPKYIIDIEEDITSYPEKLHTQWDKEKRDEVSPEEFRRTFRVDKRKKM